MRNIPVKIISNLDPVVKDMMSFKEKVYGLVNAQRQIT